MADSSTSLYDGTFATVARVVASSVTVGDFQPVVESTTNTLNLAIQLAQSELHGELGAGALDIPYNSVNTTADLNANLARIAAAWNAIKGLGQGTPVPDAQAQELRSALNAGWGEAYYVYGIVDELPSFATELSKLAQNFREAPEVLGDVASGVGGFLSKVGASFAGSIWPWLAVAAVVLILIYAGPEVKLFFAALAKGKGGA